MGISEKELIEVLQSDDSEAQLRAINILKHTRSQKVIDALIAQMDASDANIRAAITYTLGRFLLL
jgi:HEAT repeat protein